jgi:hypothetical protein
VTASQWYLAALCAVVLVVAIYAEHRLLAAAWRRYERARVTLGTVTVLAAILPLAIAGALDWLTLAVVLVAFAIAGATTTGLYIHEEAQAEARRVEQLRRYALGNDRDELEG